MCRQTPTPAVTTETPGHDGAVMQASGGRGTVPVRVVLPEPCDAQGNKTGNYTGFSVEVFRSVFKKLGVDHLGDKSLRYKAVTDAQAPAKHLIAARGTAAATLLADIDKQLGAMVANGDMARLWKKHGGWMPNWHLHWHPRRLREQSSSSAPVPPAAANWAASATATAAPCAWWR